MLPDERPTVGLLQTLKAIFIALSVWLLSPPSFAQPMTLDVASTDPRCGSCTLIFATGDIESSTPELLRTMIRSENLQPGTTIVFDSPGGSLFDGMTIGTIIRDNRFHTSVFSRSTDSNDEGATCASACAYAFLGGTHRTIGRSSRFGLHQFYGAGRLPDAMSRTQSVVSQIATYVRNMGASQEIVEIASAIRPDTIRWLTRGELSRLAVTTAEGTRFAPEWTAKGIAGMGGVMLTSDTLLPDGAVAQLIMTCGAWHPYLNRNEPRSLQLIVSLPGPQGGIAAVERLQQLRPRVSDFSIYSSDGSNLISSFRPHFAQEVQCCYAGVSFYAELDLALVSQIAASSDGFVLRWHPEVTNRGEVFIPGKGLGEAFDKLSLACQSEDERNRR